MPIYSLYRLWKITQENPKFIKYIQLNVEYVCCEGDVICLKILDIISNCGTNGPSYKLNELYKKNKTKTNVLQSVIDDWFPNYQNNITPYSSPSHRSSCKKIWNDYLNEFNM
jgi:hypothetical protein